MDEFTERGRTLPHNEDAERAVLGAILLNANSLEVAMESVSPSDFYHTVTSWSSAAVLLIYHR